MAAFVPSNLELYSFPVGLFTRRSAAKHCAETRQRIALEPRDGYLRDTLARLPAMTNQDDFAALTPANWKPAEETFPNPNGHNGTVSHRSIVTGNPQKALSRKCPEALRRTLTQLLREQPLKQHSDGATDLTNDYSF